MAQINPSIPIVGQSDSTEDPKIVTALSTLIATINALDSANIVDGSLVAADLSGTAGIADGQLASPTSPVWRPIFTLDAPVPAVVGALGTAGPAVTSGTNYWLTTGGIFASGSGQASAIPSAPWIPSTTADVTVAGKTTRLRMRTVLAVNATAPGVTITPALYLVSSFAGASGVLAPTLGAAALTTTHTTPALGSGTAAVSSTVDLSSLNASAAYCFGVAVSGALPAASFMAVHLVLEMRHT